MDVGGLNWLIIDVIAVGILLVVLAWLVMRTRSKGKSTSPRRTEEATRELYQAEDRAAKQEER